MNYDRDGQRHDEIVHGDSSPGRRKEPVEEKSELPCRPENGNRIAASRFTGCALIARAADWSRELESLGVHRFKRPEELYKALRSRSFLPEVCIVDLDSVPRNLIRSVDMRIPCPKLWVGSAAANPADIKSFGAYYARARPDDLRGVIGRLVEVDKSILLPAGLVGRQTLPLLAADRAYRERLQHYTELFSNTGLITLHGDDALELQLVAQYLAVETQRARIWEARSEASIHSVLRKVAQARRPGSDVTIVLSTDVDVDPARELRKSLPPEYSMIKLAARAEPAVDTSSFTLPRPADRPADIEFWITWFVGRFTIEHGIALSGLDEFIDSIRRALGDNPSIEETRHLCEGSVRQHATMMEERGEFMPYEDLVRNYERTILRRALARNDCNLSATARSLGLAESSLRYKLKKLGIDRRGGAA